MNADICRNCGEPIEGTELLGWVHTIDGQVPCDVDVLVAEPETTPL